ncbi:MAG: alpha/beta hydrolase [Kiritimatiellales bacterium]
MNVLLERASQKLVIPLRPDGITGAFSGGEEFEPGKFRSIRTPHLIAYKADERIRTGTAVIICPGGGYRWLSCLNEGYPVAEWLNGLGIDAYILKYRLPEVSPGEKYPVPLQDIWQAVQQIKKNGAGKTGVLGFSAGGHLAALALTHFEVPAEINSSIYRPDFGILIYPVISFVQDDICHTGSMSALLRDSPAEDERKFYSPELNVTGDTPPILLIHAMNDETVHFKHSVVMHNAMISAGIPSELCLYNEGGHGFGMGNPGQDNAGWPSVAAAWMLKNGVLRG